MRKSNRVLYLLAALKLILPFLLQNSFYQPHRDEFLYLAEGKHLAFGYMEVPPLLSVFAWITNALGASIFWIKIWPALFGVFTFVLVGKIIISLGGRTFALILGLLPFVIDGYIRLFFLFQPNFLEVFFWTAIAFCVTRFIQTKENGWLYILGVCMGLGMLSKYSVAFYILSIFIGLLFTRHKNIFFNKHFYYSLCIAFIIFLPNLLWQYNHKFPVITHMNELKETQLQFISPLDFIISQFLMNLPCVFIWIGGLIFTTANVRGRKYAAFAWAWIGVMILLIVLHGKDYYALGAYPVLFSFGAVYLERLTEIKYKWMRFALILFPLALGGFVLPLTMPIWKPAQLADYYSKTGLNKSGATKWEDLKEHPLPQDFADMIGWKEIAQKTATVYNNIPIEQRKKTLVYCRGYFTAGALNYYRKDFNLPEVYSDNASFLFWMPEKYDVQNLLLVAHNVPGKDDEVFQQFANFSIKDSLNYPLAREHGIRIMLYEHGNNKVNKMIEDGIKEMKSKYLR
jgi:hypothetical protein